MLQLRGSSPDQRSLLQLKNIYASLIYKVIGFGCSFVMVSLLLSQLSSGEYGIFVTIISVTSWFTFLDLGLGNGLKNKLSAAFATGSKEQARMLISTAYVAMSALVIAIIVLLILLFPFLPFAKLILGTQASNASIDALVKWGLCLFCLRMLGDLLNAVLLADQKAGLSALLQMVVQIVTLCIFGFLKYSLNSKNLLQFGLVYFIVPLVVIAFASVSLFKWKYSSFTPTVTYFNKDVLSSLFSLGFQFLVIQVAVIVIFTTDNLIIGHILGYQYVTDYNIAFRYFSMLSFGWVIIITPLWTAFNDAFVKGDILWIKNTIHKLEKLWLLLILAAVMMLVCSKWVYRLWLTDKVEVSFLLSGGMMIFVLVNAIGNVYVYFLNGISRIRWQVYSSVLAAIVNIPLSIFIAKTLGLGNTGVIVGSTLSILPSLAYARFLTYKIIKAG